MDRRRARSLSAAILGSAGALGSSGCGDVLGFDRGTVVSCLADADCSGGSACQAGRCQPADAGGAEAEAQCSVACPALDLCLDGVCRQGSAAPPPGPGDNAYDVQADTIACSEMGINICEWISGVVVEFVDPPGNGLFRLGVYQDLKDYPAKKWAETAPVSLGGMGRAVVPLLEPVRVPCDDAGATPVWFCVVTTEPGYTLAATSESPGDFVQLQETSASPLAGWITGALPSPWPSPPPEDTLSQRIPYTVLIYPWVVQ